MFVKNRRGRDTRYRHEEGITLKQIWECSVWWSLLSFRIFSQKSRFASPDAWCPADAVLAVRPNADAALTHVPTVSKEVSLSALPSLSCSFLVLAGSSLRRSPMRHRHPPPSTYHSTNSANLEKQLFILKPSLRRKGRLRTIKVQITL